MTAASDEARLARLTALAQLAWSDASVPAEVSITTVGAHVWIGNTPVMNVVHPRALDALEAALHVLVDDADADIQRLQREVRDILQREIDQHRSARNTPPAWVNDLADQWQVDARDAVTTPGELAAGEAFLQCARELREAAAKGSL